MSLENGSLADLSDPFHLFGRSILAAAGQGIPRYLLYIQALVHEHTHTHDIDIEQYVFVSIEYRYM